MRAVITGQVGLDKKAFLRRAAEIAAGEGTPLEICNIGDMMYAEAPDVAPGKILDLPLSRLNALRRSVFKDVLATCRMGANVAVNTHATFRWRHGLFYGFDHDQMQDLDADFYVVLVDSIDQVHGRMVRDGYVDHSLKDLMVWREEEVLATELLSRIAGGDGRFYILSRGVGDAGPRTLVQLMFHGRLKKAYLSFPMSHVGDSPGVLAEIEGFRREMKRYLVCFDPGDLEEKDLCRLALEAARRGHRTVEVGPPESRTSVETAELVAIIPDIDGQIYARDFRLIDQSDMIVSLIPELSDGRPGLSSGVERELQHAHEATRDVFVVWRPSAEPSPFITETATAVFGSVSDAVRYFIQAGYAAPEPEPRGTLFA